jgi:hypothetical protein
MGAKIRPIEPPSGAAHAVSAPSVADAWMELRRHLERRSSELNAEIRGYPSPIARCDDQLPKLLEQRARAVRLLNAAIELDAMRAASSVEPAWLSGLQGFLSRPDAATDDDAEAELRSRLGAALAGLRQETNEE